jgi:hypothetical protein
MQSAPDDIVGYSVHEITKTIALKDVLADKSHTLQCTSWNEAMTAASVLADSIADKHSTKSMCILRNTSQSSCISNGYTISHRLTKLQSEIVIVAVRRT